MECYILKNNLTRYVTPWLINHKDNYNLLKNRSNINRKGKKHKKCDVHDCMERFTLENGWKCRSAYGLRLTKRKYMLHYGFRRKGNNKSLFSDEHGKGLLRHK